MIRAKKIVIIRWVITLGKIYDETVICRFSSLRKGSGFVLFCIVLVPAKIIGRLSYFQEDLYTRGDFYFNPYRFGLLMI